MCSVIHHLYVYYNYVDPGGLRRRSAAARLLVLRVRIPLGSWSVFLRVVCCQVEISATGLSLVQGESY
jgi:hypothetical protein